MTRINLTKYGFVRDAANDFTDDGSRFTGFRFADSGSFVSKLVSNGMVYLSAHVSGNLPFEVYKTLPHYDVAVWDFNGVSTTKLTDEDLQDFYNSCVEYEREYREMESQIEYPSIEQITEKCVRITLQRQNEISKIESMMAKHSIALITKLSSYEWGRIRGLVQYLVQETEKFDPKTFPATIVGKSTSFSFVKPENESGESYWFRAIMEVFTNHGLTA
jgi:hypothetical protein